MTPFRYAHAAADDWRRALAEVTGALAGARGSLGFVYVTDPINEHLDAVVAKLRIATGIEHWVGCVGLAICATGVEYYEEPAVVAMIADLPADGFRVFPPVMKDPAVLDPMLADWLGPNAGPYIGLVHADPVNPLTENLIRGIAERTATGFLVGGLASSRGTARVLADEPGDGGIAGVMFSDAVGVQTNLSQGCSPIGPHRRISEAERNVLVRLDDRPALDVFFEDIGEVLARDLSRVGGYIFAGLPIPGSDTGDYLVRNLIGVDMDKKLVGIGDLVEPGQEIMFCRRDAASAREDLSRMLAHLKSRLSGPPRGGIYVSCLGRGASLFGDDSQELGQIRDELGDFPLVGFYANGEIFQHRLYGYTGVLTLFT
ncbi:MAG: FIST C-terminal domain-containing protein [Thiohalocapsa sp.]|uniref:FIST signal transduction protein n=1 Tax=Thiohalocapsa sp. TaxID=2497641 RepID=UPI0025F193D0|nr:FIST N-terminal domain-containing protein [Thiohalocapsa sp.]MCG6939892.1 FIST C-terminal domain-containing protein [Thiohalocapsa sp.]